MLFANNLSWILCWDYCPLHHPPHRYYQCNLLATKTGQRLSIERISVFVLCLITASNNIINNNACIGELGPFIILHTDMTSCPGKGAFKFQWWSNSSSVDWMVVVGVLSPAHTTIWHWIAHGLFIGHKLHHVWGNREPFLLLPACFSFWPPQFRINLHH